MATIVNVPSQIFTGASTSASFAMPVVGPGTPAKVQITDPNWDTTDDPAISLMAALDVSSDGGVTWSTIISVGGAHPGAVGPSGHGGPPVFVLGDISPYSADHARLRVNVTKGGNPASLTLGATITLG